MTEKQKEFLANLIAGLLISLFVVFMNREMEYPLTQRLCDGFFVAGVILMGTGGLKYFRNQGAFDMVAYSVKSVFTIHWPSNRLEQPEKNESFLDYRERKAAVRKSPNPILVAGGIYLALAVIMLALYYITQ